MAKKNNVMKIVAVSIVLLFLVSGFSVMAYGSGSEKSISSGDKSGNIPNTNVAMFARESNHNNLGRYMKYPFDQSNNLPAGLFNEGKVYKEDTNPSTQISSGNNSAGYVKYTLDLLNNTLINGNFVNTGNGLSPIGIAYDPSNGYLYVANWNSNTV